MKNDGAVIVAAGGGGPEFCGTGHRGTSDHIGVSAIMLADYVQTYGNGICSVIHGALGGVEVAGLPADLAIAGLVVVEAGGAPAGEYALHLTLTTPDGARVARSTFVITVETEGQILRSSVYVPVQGQLTTNGVHRLTASSDASELLSIPVFVRESDQ